MTSSSFVSAAVGSPVVGIARLSNYVIAWVTKTTIGRLSSGHQCNNMNEFCPLPVQESELEDV